MSNSLDPDQARQDVRPDLDPNSLQRLSTDDTSRQNIKEATNLKVSPSLNLNDILRINNFY